MPKITIPSPTIVHFRGGREAIDAKAYPEMDAFYDDLAQVYRDEIRDLAAAGCRYLQIDEVNLAYLCDPELRRQVANIGEDPATLPKTYATLLNAAIAGKPADMTVCMHLCRGNFAGAWIADGGYEPIAELLFNAIGVDGYFLEYDSARAGGFEPLRFLPKGKIAVLGLVTTKSPAMETKDELKRRIDEASRYAPLEQLALSPQCGFSSGIGGNAMTVDDEIKKLPELSRAQSRPAARGTAHLPPHGARGFGPFNPEHGRLLRHGLAGAAELARKVFQLRQPVAHRQNGFGIIDVHAGLEFERRQRCREHVHQAQCRVIGHQVAAAFVAILPLAERRLLEHGNVVGAGGDLHRIRLPQRERVDRAAGPRSA